MNHSQIQFWSVHLLELLQQLQTTPQGLMNEEARQRLLRYGSNGVWSTVGSTNMDF